MCNIYKKWIRNEDIAFIPDTFMYHEEDILYEYIINKKYKTIYNHDLSVIHLEDVSTSTVAKTELKRARYYLKHSIYPILMLRRIRKINEKGESYILNYKLMEKIHVLDD